MAKHKSEKIGEETEIAKDKSEAANFSDSSEYAEYLATKQ